MKLVAALVLGALALAHPTLAIAAPLRLWVVSEPWTCARYAPPLAREIELACDAGGGHCHVAETAAEADLVIALRCEKARGPVSVVVRDRNAEQVAHRDLVGDEEEKLRAAALFATDVRLPVAEPNHAEFVEPTTPAVPAPFVADEPGPIEPPSEPRVEPRRARGGIDLHVGAAADFSTAGTAFVGGGLMFGAAERVALGLALAHGRDWTVAHGAPGVRYAGVGTSTRIGVTLAIGAPWSDDRIGAALSGGLFRGAHTVTATSWTNDVNETRASDTSGVFFGARLVGQWHRKPGIFRPWTALNTLLTVERYDRAAFFLGFEMGIAWRAW